MPPFTPDDAPGSADAGMHPTAVHVRPRAPCAPDGGLRVPSAADFEEQKRREMGWVEEGVARFMGRQERIHAVNPSASVAGRLLIKRTHERFMVRLEAHRLATASKAHAMKDRLLPILAILDVDQVAAVTLMMAVQSTIHAGGKARDIKPQTIVAHAQKLGDAIEHEVRFCAWTKDPTVERKAIERMKRDMAGSSRAWSRRAEALRAVGGEPWSVVDRTVIGVDLLCLLAEAAPDVFVAPLVKYGNKTFRIFRLSDAASSDLMGSLEVAAAARPKFGLMIVPPRPWRYEGDE